MPDADKLLTFESITNVGRTGEIGGFAPVLAALPAAAAEDSEFENLHVAIHIGEPDLAEPLAL